MSDELHPRPMDYGDPPQCREDGCPSRPTWIAETFDDYPGLTDEYMDYLCGRHLMGFLSEWAVRDGTRVVLTRKVTPSAEPMVATIVANPPETTPATHE